MRQTFNRPFSSTREFRAATSDAVTVIALHIVLLTTVVLTVNYFGARDPFATTALVGYDHRTVYIDASLAFYLFVVGVFAFAFSMFAMVAATYTHRPTPQRRSIMATLLAVLIAVALPIGTGTAINQELTFSVALAWFETWGLVALPAALRLTSRHAFSYGVITRAGASA